jgi:hypothetical protein
LQLFDEYRAVQREHADMPSVQLQTAMFSSRSRRLPGGRAAYREALLLNPQLITARISTSPTCCAARAGRRRRKAQLQQALSDAPDNGDVMHALGLAGGPQRQPRGRAGLAGQSRGGRATGLAAPLRLRHWPSMTSAIPPAAIETLRRVHARFPADEQVLTALVNYSAETGNMAAARRYAQKLPHAGAVKPGLSADGTGLQR